MADQSAKKNFVQTFIAMPRIQKFKIIAYVCAFAVVISLWIIIVDAFLIKNNAGFTIVDLLFGCLDYLKKGFFNVGYYVGKLLNVFQFILDAIDYVWESILPYLPVQEAEIAKTRFFTFIRDLIRFVTGGFIGKMISGYVESFMSSFLISLCLSLIFIIMGFKLCMRGANYGINYWLDEVIKKRVEDEKKEVTKKNE